MWSYIAPFLIAFMMFALAFLAMDAGVMSLQGLSLMFDG